MASTLAAAATPGDWTQFGYDAQRSNFVPGPTGITAANVAMLQRLPLAIDGTVDSSPLYLRALRVNAPGGVIVTDVFVVQTTYGKALAIDARSGQRLWEYVPFGLSGWHNTRRITTASPIADPDRGSVYVAVPDGQVHKISLFDGHEIFGGWPVRVTRDAFHEKLGTALNMSRGAVLVTTGGYASDTPPYQGRVIAIDRISGRIIHVFSAMCSNRRYLFRPSSCSQKGGAIWGRSGAVVEPGSARLLVSTGDGAFDGRTRWADSVLELAPFATRLIQNWTPSNFAELQHRDTDLGSMSPAIFRYRGRLFAIQGGKDATIRLLDVAHLNAGRRRASAKTGGQLQTVHFAPTSGHGIFSAAAVAQESGRVTLFVANGDATAAFAVTGRQPRLRQLWRRGIPGTSPVLAGGLLYVYDYVRGRLNVYDPRSGGRLASLPSLPGHWNTPVIADGRILMPEGDANRLHTVGTMSLYYLPAG